MSYNSEQSNYRGDTDMTLLNFFFFLTNCLKLKSIYKTEKITKYHWPTDQETQLNTKNEHEVHLKNVFYFCIINKNPANASLISNILPIQNSKGKTKQVSKLELLQTSIYRRLRSINITNWRRDIKQLCLSPMATWCQQYKHSSCSKYQMIHT